MFEVMFFVMEFAPTTRFFSSDLANYPSLLKEPHKHTEVAWRQIPHILEGLRALPAYQSVVWKALVKIAVVRSIQQFGRVIDNWHTPTARGSIESLTIQAKRISRLSHSLRNTNEWCAQATKNWAAAQMEFQILGQRLTRIEDKVFGARRPRPKQVSQPEHTVTNLGTSSPLNNIFVSPVSVAPDSTNTDLGGGLRRLFSSHIGQRPHTGVYHRQAQFLLKLMAVK